MAVLVIFSSWLGVTVQAQHGQQLSPPPIPAASGPAASGPAASGQTVSVAISFSVFAYSVGFHLVLSKKNNNLN